MIRCFSTAKTSPLRLAPSKSPRSPDTGIPNPLFAADNTLMMFGDGKKAMAELITAIKEAV